MKKKLKIEHSFSFYFSLFFILSSHFFLGKQGLFTRLFNYDLSFLSSAITILLAGVIAITILQTFFIGKFYKSLQSSINTFCICTSGFLIFSHFIDNTSVYNFILSIIIIIISFCFFSTFSYLPLNNNLFFNGSLKWLFTFMLTVSFSKICNIFFPINISNMFFWGFYTVSLFLLLSLLEYIPHKFFENFSNHLNSHLIFKYILGTFLYIYITVVRTKFITNNFIYFFEWGLVSLFSVIYFYKLTQNIKRNSSYSYEPLWGKHKQTTITIRNMEFSKAQEYMDLFIEKGEKTPLLVYFLNQLFSLKLPGDVCESTILYFVNYKDEVLPPFSTKNKLKLLELRNKNSRFLILEDTIKKFNTIMEELS